MSSAQLLIAQDAVVTCPGCHQAFSLERGFARQALESIETESDAALAQLRAQARSLAERQGQQLSRERDQAARQQLEELKALMQQQSEQHAQALAQVRTVTEAALRPQLQALEQQLADSRGEYERRLGDAQGQLQTLRAEQVQLRIERTRLADEKAAMALAVQRQVDLRCAEREQQIRGQEQERSQLREADLQKKLDDAREQLEDAQRRMTQGSQQLQGEVLELAIEEALRREFPLDSIEEVKKGVRGADVVQHIATRAGHAPIKLLWESKRAKEFSGAWIGKLKDDMRACGAEVGVLVTLGGAVPREWPAGQVFSLHEGVYVVIWPVALQLAQLLRESLLAVHRQRIVSTSRDEKMAALYDYVTSPQFAQKLRAVHDAFQRMREELEAEKGQTLQRWARREKQLQGGLAALLGVGGEIQGLAQRPLPELELQASLEECLASAVTSTAA